MSQFDFPRINFHGKVLLDTPTANNGKSNPLTIYNQNEAQVYLPPRLYLVTKPYDQVAWMKKKHPNFQVKSDGNNSYIEIETINTMTLLSEWSLEIIGTSQYDKQYWPVYDCIIKNLTPMSPGYWNYYGDLSMSLQNVLVSGVTVPLPAGIKTFTPTDKSGCPVDLESLLGASFSFNNNFFNQGSQTSAYLCDLDSEGQMCTQIFYGSGGLYKIDPVGEKITFFEGKPCKSTARWMNLSRVLNWAAQIPMGGSASFYTTIPISQMDPAFEKVLLKYTGKKIDALFVKFIIHEVYEVRTPDYSLLPTQAIPGNPTNVPKNPAIASISGSICPWFAGDLKTTSLFRILKGNDLVDITVSGIPAPSPKGGGSPLAIPHQVSLGPAFIKYNAAQKLLSLDVSNTINEFGTTYGNLPTYAGEGDVKPFTAFKNYDFNSFQLSFLVDGSTMPMLIGSFDYASDYNMSKFLANGGMIDIPVSKISDFSKGSFLISNNKKIVLKEDDIYITTDQQGTYAEQFQFPADTYLSESLPTKPCFLRAFYRGTPIQKGNEMAVYIQNFLSPVNPNFSIVKIYDGYKQVFDVNESGCTNFAFVPNKNDLLPALVKMVMADLTKFVMRSYLVANRVLDQNKVLEPYLNGTLPVTWDIVYENIFKLYHALYPVMNAVVPFTEANWSNATMANKMVQLTDLNNWSKPLYMPITREISANQRKLLVIWAAKFNPPT